MPERTEAIEIETVDELFALMTENCIGDEKIEIGTVTSDGWPDSRGIITYADDPVYAMKWRNRLYLIIGDIALKLHLDHIEDILRIEEESRIHAEETRRKELAQAYQILAKYGLVAVAANAA